MSHLRSAPGTYLYLFVLLVTTWVLETLSGSVARRLLQERSTNLYHLSHDPVRVLVSSAFWVSGPSQLLLWLILFTVLVAPVEQWLGTGRTVTVFFTGHVGATLLTAAGLWVAIRTDLAAPSLVNAPDVGASYGFFAVAALLAYRMRSPRRFVYVAGLLAFIGTELGVSPSFTGFGHLLALAIGLSSYCLVPKARRRPRPCPAGTAVTTQDQAAWRFRLMRAGSLLRSIDLGRKILHSVDCRGGHKPPSS